MRTLMHTCAHQGDHIYQIGGKARVQLLVRTNREKSLQKSLPVGINMALPARSRFPQSTDLEGRFKPNHNKNRLLI